MTNRIANSARCILLALRSGLALVAVLLIACDTPALAAAPTQGRWVASWTSSLQKQSGGAPLVGQSVRQTVRLRVGGAALRVRLSNEFGSSDLVIDRATVALADRTGAVAPGSIKPLTSAGAATLKIPSGAALLTDPLALAVHQLQDLVVTLYFARPTVPETYQRQSKAEAAQVSPPGDFTAAVVMPVKEQTSRLFLSAVEVLAARPMPVVVVFSDTKSAGPETWPALAAERLAVASRPVALVNRSIFAGAAYMAGGGESGLGRFDRDVLATPGVTHVIVFLGNNDVIWPGMVIGGKLVDPASALSTAEITAILRQFIERAHAQGIKAIGGTFTPYEGATPVGYAREESLRKRREINQWIRTSGAFDAVIDFDRAVRDPANPERLAPAFDVGNHFTPSAAGYQAMADLVTAALFR